MRGLALGVFGALLSAFWGCTDSFWAPLRECILVISLRMRCSRTKVARIEGGTRGLGAGRACDPRGSLILGFVREKSGSQGVPSVGYILLYANRGCPRPATRGHADEKKTHARNLRGGRGYVTLYTGRKNFRAAIVVVKRCQSEPRTQTDDPL